MLTHKEYELPEVSFSHDEADPEWEKYGARGHEIEREGQTLYRWHRPPDVHKDYWEVCVKPGWAEIVTRYEAEPDDFYNSYYYLDNHPVFWKFHPHPKDTEREANHVMYLEHQYAVTRVLDIRPTRCSENHRIEDDDDLNVRTELWYEFGPVTMIPDEHGNSHWHDYMLDGGTDTYEQAIIEIARKVWEHYGNDRAVIDSEAWRKGERDYEPPDDDDDEPHPRWRVSDQGKDQSS